MPSRSLAFAVVGAIGLAFQLAALHLLVVCGVPVAAAAAMAVVVAILHNFAWHRCWTWRDRSGSWPAQLARFAGLNAQAWEESTREKPMRVIDPMTWRYDGPDGGSAEKPVGLVWFGLAMLLLLLNATVRRLINQATGIDDLVLPDQVTD